MNNQNSNISANEVLRNLGTSEKGLTQLEAQKRQNQHGLNAIVEKKKNLLVLFVREFSENPLIILLVIATLISYWLGQHVSAYYILGMIVVSMFLGIWNEYKAEKTIENLLKKISLTALVLRAGRREEIPVQELTIGDVVFLSQGSIVPADLRLLETRNLELNESALTGEAKTAYKTEDVLADVSSSINDQKNTVFMGTTVISGSGKGIVTTIAPETAFGKIAQSTNKLKPETEFQKGLTRFAKLIIKVIVILTIAIFVINWLLGHNPFDSLLFALAIAVGLTPEMLPVVVTVTLAHGARRLAKQHVIAKQLMAIENLGNMDVLCTDKTGTLTEGNIQVVSFLDMHDKKKDDLIPLALLCNNAIVHHKAIGNAIDVALWNYALKQKIKLEKGTTKLAEEPFDYNRKAMYSVVETDGKAILIAKGSPEAIIALCCNIKDKKAVHDKYIAFSNDGLRVIAVASKKINSKSNYDWEDAIDLTFHGYISFLDVPKQTAKAALKKLRELNVITKVITGDSEIITQKICKEVGMETTNMLTGKDIDGLSAQQLLKVVETTDIFARVSPEQKLQVIQALQKNGHTVGYMGDGINDLPSLHSADVGISVNTAVDVAKNTAAIVLLRKSLSVIADGIIEGRKTFNNTIKYILMGTSSNFGNMFSAAGASFFLPFLPMTPVQILLNNSLYDMSQLSIPTDNVDPETLLKPRHWDISFIKKYMLFFGPISSVFDFITFGLLIYVFHARGALFQTGWFMESLATQILVVFVIRTIRKPFFRSRPSNWLLATCFSLVAIAWIIPYTPLAQPFGFLTPPPLLMTAIIGITVIYVFIVEGVKNRLLQRHASDFGY